MRLGFVVPRYGVDVVGGAETLCRGYAERLAQRGHQVEVLTTCAADHHSWANAHAPGDRRINGVLVRRHRVSLARDHATVARLERKLAATGALTHNEELAWMASAGHSDALLDGVAAAASRLDALIFLPYLFATTCYGALVRPEKSLIIPCLHDEGYARFALIQRTLRAVRGLIFNSSGERDLALHLLGGLPPHRVVGAGFDPPGEPDPDGFRRRHRLNGADHMAYAGRREGGKNWPLLLQWTLLYGRAMTARSPVRLLAMGSGPIPVPAACRDLVDDVGFVSAEDRRDAFSGSVAVVQLSRNESFSYVLVESWLAGTPVVVHAACDVTRTLCEESGGGLWVSCAEEFAETMERLRGDAPLRSGLAAAGREHALRNYLWPAVVARLEAAIAELLA